MVRRAASKLASRSSAETRPRPAIARAKRRTLRHQVGRDMYGPVGELPLVDGLEQRALAAAVLPQEQVPSAGDEPQAASEVGVAHALAPRPVPRGLQQRACPPRWPACAGTSHRRTISALHARISALSMRATPWARRWSALREVARAQRASGRRSAPEVDSAVRRRASRTSRLEPLSASHAPAASTLVYSPTSPAPSRAARASPRRAPAAPPPRRERAQRGRAAGSRAPVAPGKFS